MKESNNKVLLSTQNIITLVIGLLSVAVSMYVYLGSKKSAALNIEQISSITYASVQDINKLSQFELTVNGEKVQNLIAIPFRVTNVGKELISSQNNGPIRNLFEDIKFEVKFNEADSAKIIAAQIDSKSDNIKVSFERISNNTFFVKLGIKYLNPQQEESFSLLTSSRTEPNIKIINNPLAGGRISFYQNNIKVEKEDFWYLFKHKYFLNFISVLFMAQFIIVIFYLIYQARILYLDKYKDKENDDWNVRQKQEKERNNMIEAKIEKLIEDNITKNDIIQHIKNEQLPIPKDSFLSNASTALMTIYELTKKALIDEWRWSLEQEFPLEIDSNMKDSNKIYFPQWYDWEEFFKNGILLLGLISLAIFILGYFLYFK